MGTMNKLRDNTGVILWILVIAFGVIWVLQDSGAFDVVGQLHDEYSGALDNRMQQYQQQPGENMPPQMLDLERDRIFEALVVNKLREREMDRMGITVTDEELADMVLGDNPHQIIQIYFGDGQGGINRALLQNFIEDPEAREEWIQLEEYLRAERRREKLDQLITSTVRVSEQDVLDEYLKRNRSANVEYVALRYAAIPDDSIQVTDRDFRRFYDANKEDFKREKTYTINYVTVSKLPTAEDSSLVISELERARERFAIAENDSLFLIQNGSERPYTSAYFKADDLDPEIADAVFSNPEPGRIVGPIVAGGEAHLVKIVGVRPAEDVVVKARHILFRAPEGDAAERNAARTKANQALARINDGADFGALARELSEDPGSAPQGGELGWFGKGRMVEPFENAALSAPVGRVVGPVETSYGYHLIQVTQRANQEVQLADLAMRIQANVETLSRIEGQLDDLQFYATDTGDFEAEAQRRNLQVQQVQVEAGKQFIPGIGNSRALMNFLEGGKKGSISPVIELNDQFVVAEIASIQKAGYRPLEEVRAELEPRVKTDKKRQIQEERLRRALQEHGFDGLAQAVGTEKRSVTAVKFDDPVVPALGREPKFTGTALGLKEGQVSDVIVGENAVFVLKATSVNEPAPITEVQKEQIRTQLFNQQRSTVLNQWLTSLREQADVKDNRRLFQQ